MSERYDLTDEEMAIVERAVNSHPNVGGPICLERSVVERLLRGYQEMVALRRHCTEQDKELREYRGLAGPTGEGGRFTFELPESTLPTLMDGTSKSGQPCPKERSWEAMLADGTAVIQQLQTEPEPWFAELSAMDELGWLIVLPDALEVISDGELKAACERLRGRSIKAYLSSQMIVTTPKLHRESGVREFVRIPKERSVAALPADAAARDTTA